MRSTLLISMTLFLAALSAPQATLSLHKAQYVLAHSDGGSGGDKTDGGSGGAKTGGGSGGDKTDGGSGGAKTGGGTGGGSGGAKTGGGTGGEHVSESDASQFYDAPRAPIGDMTDIAPTKDVVSATSDARCLVQLAKAVGRARHGGAPVSILQYGDSHVARGIEPETIAAAFKSVAPLHYHTMAKVGISATYPLSDAHGWLDQPIRRANPDLIIIAFGSNDSAEGVDKVDYGQNYQTLIDSIKERAPHASILMVGPADGDSIRGTNKGHTLPGLDDVVAVQKELAAKNGFDFFDLRESMGGRGSIEDWYGRGLAGPDKLHFTTKGYEIIGKSIVQHINNELDETKKR